MAKKTLQGMVILFSELVVLYVIMLLVSSCGPAVKDQWPYPMTSFFAYLFLPFVIVCPVR